MLLFDDLFSWLRMVLRGRDGWKVNGLRYIVRSMYKYMFDLTLFTDIVNDAVDFTQCFIGSCARAGRKRHAAAGLLPDSEYRHES
jgi:hypothetical protein